jgi:hypothetical protein
MIVKLFLSFVIPFSLGFTLVQVFLPLRKTIFSHLLLKFSLAAGLGVGIASCTYFLTLLSMGPRITEVIIYEAVLVVILMAIVVRYSKTPILPENEIHFDKTLNDLKLRRVLLTGYYSVLGLAAINLIYMATLLQHGTWDAWAIWNMHARFIFRGGEHWTDSFTILMSPNHHPDYPLLLPLTVARGWTYIGKETFAVPMVISLLFTFSLVGLIYSALTLLRSKSQGNLASLVLLSTPVFLFHGARQQADVPIAFFFLASLVFLFLQERYPKSYGLSFLSGAMAGLAGWTKNEGLLFLVSFFAARIITVLLSQSRKMHIRQLMYFALGSMPVLAIILYFKIYLAPPNEIVGGRTMSEIMVRLGDLSKYAEILKIFLIGITFIFPHVFLLLFYSLYSKIKVYEKDRISVITSLLVLVFMMMGFFAVYLISPYDVNWHLKWSLDRILLQLWPGILLTYFMIVRTPEEALMLSQIEINSKFHSKGRQTC